MRRGSRRRPRSSGSTRRRRPRRKPRIRSDKGGPAMELPTKTPVRSYKTEFKKNESPISEGGLWLNGRKDGIDWCDVLVKDGVAFGEVSRNQVVERRAEQAALGAGIEGAAVGDYDDPTAVLTGQWGPNQCGKVRVFSRNQTDKYFQEVQIRLRHNMKPKFCSGYEVFFRVLDTEAGYAEIVRWNGPVGGWTSLKKLIGKKYGVKDGAIIEASIVGNVITGYLNGQEMISVVDDNIKSGAPGVGFNFGVGTTNADHGVTSFEVHTYD